MRSLRLILATILCVLVGSQSSALAAQVPATDKVPITTSSPEARDLYLKGRDLAEWLRANPRTPELRPDYASQLTPAATASHKAAQTSTAR
jgi:hypothetical protein